MNQRNRYSQILTDKEKDLYEKLEKIQTDETLCLKTNKFCSFEYEDGVYLGCWPIDVIMFLREEFNIGWSKDAELYIHHKVVNYGTYR